MSLDVCILAGGLGTRLRGIWDGPKCLVPVGPKKIPLLEVLFRKLEPLKSRTVVLFLGQQAKEVLQWLFKREEELAVEFLPGTRVLFSVEPCPLGTLGAVRLALPLLAPSLLILNGDTLPLFDLAAKVEEIIHGYLRMNVSLFHSGNYSGITIVQNAATLRKMQEVNDPSLDWILLQDSMQVSIENGFIDVGTPEGFKRSQQWEQT